MEKQALMCIPTIAGDELLLQMSIPKCKNVVIRRIEFATTWIIELLSEVIEELHIDSLKLIPGESGILLDFFRNRKIQTLVLRNDAKLSLKFITSAGNLRNARTRQIYY